VLETPCPILVKLLSFSKAKNNQMFLKKNFNRRDPIAIEIALKT